ncbi:hypothetical protein G6M85_20935 [Agrobacterium tumefaciens]|uniref:hypothetical protein n=1 Tax=Agrobacterium tumefaciens TaxID=358 RepID=UPI00157167CF|nr:hypothetical protein [Agrobacterium tumefaciens]NTE68075.1 hypothetical protein [Agrobacterium tumefaciens]
MNVNTRRFSYRFGSKSLLVRAAISQRGHVPEFLYRVDFNDDLQLITDGMFRARRWTTTSFPHAVLKAAVQREPQSRVYRICFFATLADATKCQQEYFDSSRHGPSKMIRCTKSELQNTGFHESWDDGFHEGIAYLFWRYEAPTDTNDRFSDVGIDITAFEKNAGGAWQPYCWEPAPEITALSPMTDPLIVNLQSQKRQWWRISGR